MLEKRHPNLWLFISYLKDEQARTEDTVRAACRGSPGPAMRRKWRRMEEKITRLKEQLQRGQRDEGQYWDAVRYVIQHFTSGEMLK